MPSTEHTQLAHRAAEWLFTTKRFNIALIDPQTTVTRELPDVIAWRASESWLVECKVSRSDFLSDQKKMVRIYPQYGMGNYRIYFAPDGLIDPAELPDGWGLAVPRKSRIFMLAEPTRFNRPDHHSESKLLQWALRRERQGVMNGALLTRNYNLNEY